MKKKCCLLFVFLWLFTCLFACNKEVENKPLQKDQPYTFYKSECIVNEDFTIEDLRRYIPPTHLSMGNPTTVEEFKQIILANLDKYYVVKNTAEGREQIYFDNGIETIQISDTVCTFSAGTNTAEFAYTVENNVYTVEEFPYSLVYENNLLYYAIECENTFAVRHYFSL